MMKSNVEKTETERSYTKTETYEDSQSPHIENEEWLAFIQMSMQELLNGEFDTLKHQNLVSNKFDATSKRKKKKKKLYH